MRLVHPDSTTTEGIREGLELRGRGFGAHRNRTIIAAMIITVTPNPVLDRTLTVPEIVLNEMVRVVESRDDWGGKGFNVSRALLALGKPSVAMGLVGGAVGEKLRRGLESLGLATDLVGIAGETRTNIVITDERATQYIKVNEPGPMIAPDEIHALLRRAAARARPGDLWALCGSLPPGMPPDFFAKLTREIQAAGARVLLDTSGEPFGLGVRAQPFAIKPNLPEASAWLDRPLTSPTEAAAAVDNFLELGITLVALSLGAEGLMLASTEGRVWVRPPAVRALNPVGAGDALVAGLLFALDDARPLHEVARWGVASGTAAAMRQGVAVGTRAEVEALYAQVTQVPWPEEGL